MDLNCYVLHVKDQHEDRKKSIIDQFAMLGVSFKWILEYDAPEINQSVLSAYKYKGNSLRPSEISCCLKHIIAWEKIALGDTLGGFIFEDDVIINQEKFFRIIPKALRELADEPDKAIACIGDGCAMYVPWTRLQRGRLLYQAELMRAADSYYIRKEAAKAMADRIHRLGFSLPADHLINKLCHELGIAIYWVEPTVVSQGSHTGRFSSMLKEHDERGIKQKTVWAIKKIRRKYIYPLIGVDFRKMNPKLRQKLKIKMKEKNKSF
ncbi:glycosyltransferase family 25 protein [Thermodesulfobacteriota bacterium]